MSDANEVFVCASDALEDGGKGVRFPVRAFGGDATGFAVRHAGKVYAYLNRCAHVPTEMDSRPGEFLDGETLSDGDFDVPPDRLDGRVVQLGKRRFRRFRRRG